MAKNLRSRSINQIIYIAIGSIIALIILGISLFIVLEKRTNSDNTNLKIGDNQSQAGIASEQSISEEASSSIGKNVKELAEYEELSETETIQVKTTNNEQEVNKVENEIQQLQSQETNVQASNNEENSTNVQETQLAENTGKEELPKDPIFTMPIEGDIVKQYGKEKLIYSDTLKEWTTHLGIDIKADKASVVKASTDGCIKSIKNDPRYGLTVVIEHENGFTSVYSNLLTAEFVVVGENVKTGQTIGTVGNSATFEIVDEPHLHFEILKDGNSVDPEMYIK